jgi:hypothetical protein
VNESESQERNYATNRNPEFNSPFVNLYLHYAKTEKKFFMRDARARIAALVWCVCGGFVCGLCCGLWHGRFFLPLLK